MKTSYEAEKVVLVYVERPKANVEQDLYELRELISTANCKIVFELSQKRESLDPVTVLGSGKLDELKNSIKLLECQADAVIFSCQLTSTQRSALEKSLECKIVDKIDLILDIFALRATSAEGKKQVELAQLSYNLATKSDGDFSRQGAGIGTRGPGETKLETNKRLIRDKIHRLKQELNDIEARRAVTRKKRENNKVFTVALVGYTNAGKSTLFNLLTDSAIYADDKLFATLDTTVRKISLSSGVKAVICDTVGFIKELPTTLLNAFKSTLEEAANADLLLNVCDVSDPNVSSQIAVTESILAELSADVPIIRVYNKCDKEGVYPMILDGKDVGSVFISARTGKNVDELKRLIEKQVIASYSVMKLRTDIEKSSYLISLINKYSGEFNVEYYDNYAVFNLIISKKYARLFSDYLFFG